MVRFGAVRPGKEWIRHGAERRGTVGQGTARRGSFPVLLKTGLHLLDVRRKLKK